ncbi:MAG TPA: alpha/beta fold hydrolase [Gemmatimonadaceae bacterium]|nr:alpha/beta fold hydrolase [Gemmatimonadaceae bacterium]
MSEDLGAQRVGNWSLCGAGRYDLTMGGQSVGSETFDIACHPGGYTATGRTQLSMAGAGIDLTTHLEVGADLVPASASAKGTVNGQPFDQSGTFRDGTATLTTNGQQQSVPYTKGASWLGGNIFYANAFIAARYDEARGGSQQIPVFPQIVMTLERAAADTVRLDNGESAAFTRFVARVATQQFTLWRDGDGRLAVIASPAQQFAAVRPESAKWLPALTAKPGSGASAAPAPSATTIDYSAPPGATFTAEEVTIPVATYSLAGTLLVPKGGTRHPAAVMVTGSGLQTRDQRIPLPGLEQYAPFRQIAERLASNGIAVLRVDDRGIGGSTGRETLENATTTSLAEDTRAQITWLRSRKEIDPQRIVVIGHSEGASIAAMIGASDPKLAAVVMMAGVAKRGAEVSIEQQEDMLRSDTTMTEAAKQGLREQQKEAVKTVLAGGDLPGQKANAWIREYFAYDPLPTARKVKQPLLILQGERDRQVDQSHAQILAAAVRDAGNKDVTVKVFPTLNHLFLPSKTGSFNEYSHLTTTKVPDDVLVTLTDWVKARTGVK